MIQLPAVYAVHFVRDRWLAIAPDQHAASRECRRDGRSHFDTLAAPHVFPFVAASLAASRDRYSKSIGEARMMVGNAIRMMCRSPKSRAGCHFAAAIGLRSMLEDFAPTIPDWANDQHTMKGKAMGRGLDHFRKEGAKLVPPPTGDDPFEDEAYRLWALKQQSK